jgi:uncharacterized protein (DUF1800 family)
VAAITDDNLRHLLRRAEFAVRPARFNALRNKELATVVADVVTPSAADLTPATPASLNAFSDSGSYDQWVAIVQWWCDRMARNSSRPIAEKMALFWHGHFTSGWGKVFNAPAMAAQNRLYRKLALGSFRDLAQQMAIEPAMLLWLDNAENKESSPNQNFARELMELFLLGVNQYTEDDVVGASRAWAGYSLDWNLLHNNHVAKYVYRAADHAAPSATWPLLGVTQHWTGPKMIDHILTNATLRLTAARFICKKLWEFFAYQNPDPAIVDALAQELIANSWNIRILLSAMFQRAEFYSDAAKAGSVRSPVEYVVASLVHTNSTAAQLHPEWTLEDMGQKLMEPPNVSGWRLNDYWINTSAWTGRAEFASYARWVFTDRGQYQAVKGMSAAAATDWMAANFGIAPLSDVTRNAIIGWINSEADESWTVEPGIVVMTMLAPEFHRG